MKTIGLIGGMSWESSLEYYRIINETVQRKLGGFHSAQSLMYSVDFAAVEDCQHQGRWQDAAGLLADAARNLEKGGADFLVICANTMHKVVPEVQKHIKIPILHIADVTARAIKERGLRIVGLLGTRFTMEEGFYKDRLVQKHGLEVIIPGEKDRELIHNVLYDQIRLGDIDQAARNVFKKAIDDLASEGAEGIILGCTEIFLFVKQEDYKIPLFDTTRIHAEAAAEFALEESP
jgi:aspartate racemase